MNGTAHDTLDTPRFNLGDFCIDEPRPMKVVVIGAGYSGITAGIRFRQKVSNLNLTIYEAHAGIGGTWFANRYPGIACDIPSHTYQLTFAENPNWSSFYAPGHEIRDYIQSVAEKYKLLPYIKLKHRLVRAQYNESSGKWILIIHRILDSGDFEEFEDIADVLFTGMGGLSRMRWPHIDGLENFQGKLIHSADWKTGEDDDNVIPESWKDKTVAVIGVGSSAIQIVPTVQPRVKKLVNYVRGKTWISPTFVQGSLSSLSKQENGENYLFTEEEKTHFASDTEYYKKFRYEMETELNSVHQSTIVGNPMQEGGRKYFHAMMLQKLAKKPWIADHIVPSFAVACRRLTPGPGYLEALCEDNVEFVPVPIKRVTKTGIETEDGKHTDLDIIVCATGFDTTFKYGFPLIGRAGKDLAEVWKDLPRAYMGIAVDGYPNWFQSLGPASAVGAGSLLILIEKQVDYAVAATLKMQRERLKSIEIKSAAVDDFNEYLESYFPTTVFGQKCRSWYKMGKEEGPVVALWPGSCLHAARALTNPRWEDFSYEPLDGSVKNRFYWLGDGQTVADKNHPGSDKAWYLKEIDIPPGKQTVSVCSRD
ncbi:FAD/NAD-binding domain-containing protein [Mycena floridula]|nr:FAD/NAD-binding domain-containing protein [Mycena floridula]